MIDVRTQKPIEVIRGMQSTAMFYIAASQLPTVQSLFDQNKVSYWLSESEALLGDGLTIRGVILSRNENHDRVQALLDAAP